MNADDIRRVIAEKRAQMPRAEFAQIVVPKTWPDTHLGSNVCLIGSLRGRYVGPAGGGGSLIDLKLADADAWLSRVSKKATR